MNDYLDFAKTLALQTGEIMLKHFHPNVLIHEKGDSSIVTEADEAINRLVIEEIRKRYPEHSVEGEEESSKKIAEFTWLCDPIDGTVPYAKGVPVSVFSLALVKDGEPQLGVVYDPFMKRLYTAIKGQGALLNGKPIHVSDRQLAKRTTINVEWWPEAPYDIETPIHELSLETKAYVLHLGCVANAACWVASGRYDACIYAGTNGKALDIAAVKVIVEEAGGQVTDLFGAEQRYDNDINGAIISNGRVHQQLVDIFARNLTNRLASQ